jgi:hypothetical protein
MKQLKLKFNLIEMKNSKISRIVEASNCVFTLGQLGIGNIDQMIVVSKSSTQYFIAS